MRHRLIAICGVALTLVSAGVFAAKSAPVSRRYYVSTVFSWWPSFRDMSLFQKFVDESKQKGMNSVCIDIPWTIQKNNGDCDFTDYDARIDYIISHSMSVFIRVNTTNLGGQTPAWLTDEMLQQTPDGNIYKRDTDGGTLPSLAHPVVRERIVGFFRAVARHYQTRYPVGFSGERPIVAFSPAFDLYMQSEYSPDADVDYSPAAQRDFLTWAKLYYKTIAAFNDRCGTTFASFDNLQLKDVHNTAKELYFEFTLQRILDAIGDTVHRYSDIPVGLQTGCIWDNAHRRTMHATQLLNKLDWLFIADAPDSDHGFSTDYARCSAKNRDVANGIEAGQPTATNGRFFNQGVRAFEHGASAVFVDNWDLSSLRNNDKWTFLHFIGNLTRFPLAHPKPDRAIYVSTWDLINNAAPIDDYISAYKGLSDDGKKAVDVLSDDVISLNPSILSQYTEIYLPANWTIPPAVRNALHRVDSKLKVAKPLVAGTLDEYGKASEPFAKQ